MAIRFGKVEGAEQFKSKFEECQKWNSDLKEGKAKKGDEKEPEEVKDA